MPRPIPLIVLATVDPVLRDTALFGLVTDTPGVVLVRHDIIDADDGGSLRRVVVDTGGVIEDVLLPLAHACLSCAVREDAIPTLRRLSEDGRWVALVLALPVSAPSLPVAGALAHACRRGGELPQVSLASVVGAVDVSTCEHDLLDDDLLAERHLELTYADRRSVGEALSAQLGHADVLAIAGDPSQHPAGSDLLDHLRAPDSLRVDSLYELDMRALMNARHDTSAAERRLDPMHTRATAGPTDHGVWSLELSSERPFHPERLVDQVERLGAGRLHSRGTFWVANRPLSACIWHGAGGQLSVGDHGPWKRHQPFTRLVFTGNGTQKSDLRSAFEDMLVTPAELTEGLGQWLGREDVLEPWLGTRSG